MNKKAERAEHEKSASDYYKLNVRAVEDLVNADASNSPPVSEAELRKYRSGFRLKMPDRLKAVLLKAWFAGVICYFFMWGLSTLAIGQIEMLIILGTAHGVVTDLIANHLFRLYARPAGSNDRFMMFPRKSFASFPLNILYSLLLVFCVAETYNTVNTLAVGYNGKMLLGVEPILFGVFTTAWDFLFLSMKRFLLRIAAEAKQKVSDEGNKYSPKG